MCWYIELENKRNKIEPLTPLFVFIIIFSILIFVLKMFT